MAERPKSPNTGALHSSHKFFHTFCLNGFLEVSHLNAEQALEKYAANQLGASLDGSIPGPSVLFVDIRSTEEQGVSMIPGALTKTEFEAICRSRTRKDEERNLDLVTITDVICYCTIGGRSGNYVKQKFYAEGSEFAAMLRKKDVPVTARGLAVGEPTLAHTRTGQGGLVAQLDGGGDVKSRTRQGGCRSSASAPSFAVHNFELSLIGWCHAGGDLVDGTTGERTNRVHAWSEKFAAMFPQEKRVTGDAGAVVPPATSTAGSASRSTLPAAEYTVVTRPLPSGADGHRGHRVLLDWCGWASKLVGIS